MCACVRACTARLKNKIYIFSNNVFVYLLRTALKLNRDLPSREHRLIGLSSGEHCVLCDLRAEHLYIMILFDFSP